MRRSRDSWLVFPVFGTVVVAATLTASCDRCGGSDAGKDAGGTTTAIDAAASPHAAPSSSSASEAHDAAPQSTDAATAAASSAAATPDAGPSSCRLVYGPAEQPFRGPATIVVTPTELKLVANDSGKPRIFPVPLAPPPAASAPSVMPPKPASFVAMRSTPCEVAGRWAYCPTGGSVYRTTLGANDTKVIAKNQPSTRVSAAPVGGEHAVVATLDARRTTEGVMMQAFITLDDGETVRLSEDGAGATVVRLVARGDKAVAIYLDARTSMLPVHARPMSFAKNQLALADDAVVFVGGPPERSIDVVAAGAGKSFFALVPIGRDSIEFGLAAIPIAEHPKDDVQPVWSLYPNGLDPAPIAATVAESGAAWVARVRPSERMAGAPRVVELGRLDAAGAFSSLGVISEGKRVTDMAIAADSHGSVWILYGDAGATWLERRVCPP